MKYKCTICGHIYDEEKEGVKWEDLPEDWKCPLCKAGKDKFVPVEETTPVVEETPAQEDTAVTEVNDKVCPNCGEHAEKDAHFCRKCGTKLD